MVAQPLRPTVKPARIRTKRLLRLAKDPRMALVMRACPQSPQYEESATIEIVNREGYGDNPTLIFSCVTYPEVSAQQYAAWQEAARECLRLWASVRPTAIGPGAWRHERESLEYMVRQWRVTERIAAEEDALFLTAEPMPYPGSPLYFPAVAENVSLVVYPQRRGSNHFATYIVVSQDERQHVSAETTSTGRYTSRDEALRAVIQHYAEVRAERSVNAEDVAARDRGERPAWQLLFAEPPASTDAPPITDAERIYQSWHPAEGAPIAESRIRFNATGTHVFVDEPAQDFPPLTVTSLADATRAMQALGRSVRAFDNAVVQDPSQALNDILVDLEARALEVGESA